MIPARAISRSGNSASVHFSSCSNDIGFRRLQPLQKIGSLPIDVVELKVAIFTRCRTVAQDNTRDKAKGKTRTLARVY